MRARLEKAEESLREILSGESDALFIAGTSGGQLFTLKGADLAYRTLIENMSEGALTLTSAGLILYANRRFAEMLGTPLEKVIGTEIHSWFAPESRPGLRTLLQNDAAGSRREELDLAAVDGTKVPVNLSVSHLKLEGMPDSFCMVATDLTEQKRNEGILAEEKLARAILEQAADAIVICDASGRIIRASKQAQVLYGNNPLGQDFEHAFPLRQPDGAAFSPIGDIDANPRKSVEASLERDGRGFDLLVSVGHLKGARSELLGSVITLTDITERKRSEKALRTSEQRLELALEAGEVGVWDLDLIHDTSWRSLQHDRIFGYESLLPEWSQEIFLRHVVPEDRDRVSQCFEEASRTDQLDFECQVTRTDQDRHWIHVRGKVYRDPMNRPVGILGTVIDITERIHSANALRESELRYHSLFENMLEGYAYCGTIFEQDRLSDFIYLEVNGAFGKLTGLKDVVGRKISDVIPGVQKDNLELFQIFEQVALTGQPKKVEAYISALSIWLAITVYSSDREHFVAVFENITERKDSEARILYLNRVYAMLSGINTLTVRVPTRDDLFREACRIAVEKGGFRMALIAIVDPTGMQMVPIASAGADEKFLSRFKDRFAVIDGGQLGDFIVTRAIGGKKTVVINDLQSNPEVVFRNEYAEAGVHSAAVLPLIVAEEAVGVLALYAKEIEFFQEEEIKLLTELAGDIAFAIDHINKQERLDYLAYYDVLTGLANRSLFLERLAQYLRNAAGGHRLAVALLDLERFKNINDSLGRPAGDALLRQVAEWLKQSTGDASLLARVDADHFAFVQLDTQDIDDLAQFLEQRIEAFLQHPFRLNDAVFRIAVKVGVVVFPGDGTDAETLFRNAEAALKKAKASGQRYLFYTQAMTEAVAGKLTLENQLRQALDKEEFVLHYQPKVNLESGKMSSAEALLRWNDPRTGLVPPGRFIPILEETGLIYDVGRWALRQAIKDYLRWRAAGLPAVRIAVNVSPLQLRNRGFIDEIKQVIGIDAHASDGLELEITESVIMEDIKHNIAILGAIRAMGVTIAIDDFGTGFSSLSYLARLPVDTLKIDRSFIDQMTVTPEGLGLVSTVITLAHSLKLKVVAEGVETAEQSRLLSLLRCDEMQGFLFSKPVPAGIFETKFLAPPTPG